MNDLPRQKLREIIQQHGRYIVEDPQRCRALLLDLCGEHRREVNVLSGALNERVAADLLASKDHTPLPLVLSRLTQRLHDNLALDKEAARWAVETWAVALGVASESELAAPITCVPKGPVASANFLFPLAPGVTLDLVYVPAGEFLMGSYPAKDRQARHEEMPQHTLYLPEYLIGKYPVTNAQYAAFVKAAEHEVPEHWTWINGGQIPSGKENHPVVYVSWNDAIAFFRWSSQQTAQAIGLPSEAEWEKAARGTDGRIRPWGNEAPDNTRCNFDKNMNDTTPVGRFSPQGDSPYGCADMAGNVWEWCQSKYEPYPYRPDDGREQVDDGGELRVVRGGSWYFSRGYARCASRFRRNPDHRDHFFGFRFVVRPPSP